MSTANEGVTTGRSTATEAEPAGPTRRGSTTGSIGTGVATAGDITGMGVLDLLHVSAEELERTTSINEVGVVLVRQSMAGRFGSIPMHSVGSVVTVPDGDQVVTKIGVVQLTGEALAAEGHEEETLVIVGPLIITTPVERVAYRRLVVVGVLVAPGGSEVALASVALTGVSTYYPPGSAPRIVIGQERWSREFFEELGAPVSLVIVGEVTIEAGVPRDLLRERVESIALVGKIYAPRELVPLVQVLSPNKLGEIAILDEEGSRQATGG